MDFLTREVFDLLIIANIVVGLLLAGRRFYQDIRRPPPASESDTQENLGKR